MLKLVNTLSDLVAFQTVDGYPAQKMACFDYIEERLERAGLAVTRQQHGQEPSIVAMTQATKTPKVLLTAHLDVVPGKTGLFHLSEDNGRLYGRGVYDMKFAAACFIELVDSLAEDLSDYDFGVMFTSDEEIGGENGVGQLVEQGYRADVCILPDAGEDWKIESTCNGGWFVKLAAKGEPAHGSRPWEGNNAIDNMLAVSQEIKQLFAQTNSDT